MPNIPDNADPLRQLIEIMRVLRSEAGCPWDREQTLQSLAPYLLAETYEVLDAIDRGDMMALREELGDLVFEVVFLAQVATENGSFTLDDSLALACEKLIRRHPHVFGNAPGLDSADAVREQWHALKRIERSGRAAPTSSSASSHEQAAQSVTEVLGRIPAQMPALLRALEIGSRAAAVGFDWARDTDVLKKVEEELRELGLARSTESGARIDEELGDLLFAIANLARKLGLDPEGALRRANEKFVARFERMAALVSSRTGSLEQASLDEMEDAWQRAKREVN